MKLNRVNGGYRNLQAVSVLNKLDTDNNGNPVGLKEARDDPTSANFGTDREPRRGGCYHIVPGYFIYPEYNPDLSTIDILEISFKLKVETDNLSTQILFGFSSTYNDSNVYLGLLYSGGNFRITHTGHISGNANPVPTDKEFHDIRFKYIRSENRVYFYLDDNIYSETGFTVTGIYDLFIAQQHRNVKDAYIFDFNLYVNSNHIWHFKCSENSGDTCYDSSGNDNHGGIINAITVPPEEDPNSIHQYQDVYSFENEVGYSQWENLLKYSEEFDNIVWEKGSNTILTPNAAMSPLGDMTADRLTLSTIGGTFIEQGIVLNGTYTLSFYTKAVSGNSSFYLNYKGIKLSTLITVEEVWTRVSFTFTDTSINKIGLSNGADSFETDIYIWGAQLNKGAIIHPYVKTQSLILDHANRVVPKNESITLPPFQDILGNDLQYFGKVGGRAQFKGSSCWLGGGAAYLSIAGLLTTDTITVFGNSDIPTIPFDGQLHLGNLEKAYGILIQRSAIDWAYFPLCESIINPSSQIYYDISGNNRHATLVNGTFANEGKQDEFHYLQNGLLDDGVNQVVPILADKSAFADGSLSTDTDAILQDSKSFLNTGCKLQQYNYPALIQSEQSHRFWTDTNDDVVDVEFIDCTGVESGRIFEDVSESNKIKNIRTHKAALTGRQLNTEKRITNN